MLTLLQFFQSCSVLPNSIKSHTPKTDCLQQFRQVFSSQEAKNASNVLYTFVCEKKIPRVKSESVVIYIGQTKENLSSRYMKYAEAFCSGENSPLYSYIISHYGNIRIAYLPVQSLKQAETELLKDYYKLYKEYPPRNFQRRSYCSVSVR